MIPLQAVHDVRAEGEAAFLTNIVPFVLMGIIMTGVGTYWNILIMATYQELIPNKLYGRIHGTRRTLVWGMMPFGSLLGGWVSTFGLRIPIFIGAVLATLISALNLKFLIRLVDFASTVNYDADDVAEINRQFSTKRSDSFACCHNAIHLFDFCALARDD